MAKEWILNSATSRWGLNKKNSVGTVSEWIRECSPKNKEDWKECYKKKLSEFLNNKGIKISPDEYLEELGKKLYIKITEVMQSEINEVKEEDCIEYIYKLVIDRTYEGYDTEIKTIYGQLEKEIGLKIEPAPDEWDRKYNVDFFIKIGDKYIGIQIKPITYKQINQNIQNFIEEAHKKFQKKYGGKVFIIFSIKEEDGKKKIFNKEVIEDIKKEIERLKGNE
ncbi:hypothetical protein JCM14244_01050 [Venenivibrio stagnispumantis]|uniref:MjaI restriction endonuclease n=1 Tax=Venenivibrio stagnispumantis TaxID=407998 RepID=A0AA45WKA2_9AQUI|nr:MjaI family restriction endonuclease [Venenivibrio stagnispumantis]MCW4573508.1 MjaI family restriction endonuclease [Venenivibrio stagnispumantis]SMP06395.1 MjaI restriction endonuclease [Venenivibrio stagnispumantis]